MGSGSDIGVTIEKAVRGSPAAKAGVHAGDRIVSVETVRVTTPAQVLLALQRRAAGGTLQLGLERAGREVSVSVVLARRPSADDVLKMDLVGASAPSWSSAVALPGAPASLSRLRGRVVLVDFWASWCVPCRMLTPKLNTLKDKFGAQGLTVVGITTDDAETAATYAEAHQIRYGIVVDPEGRTSRSYGITAMPTLLLVDKKGFVRDVLIGYEPDALARMETTIAELIAEPSPESSPASAKSVPVPDVKAR